MKISEAIGLLIAVVTIIGFIILLPAALIVMVIIVAPIGFVGLVVMAVIKIQEWLEKRKKENKL